MTDTTQPQALLIEHRFKASRARVFQAWTDADQLKQWFSPTGMTMSQCVMDLRPGGAFHYALRSPVGMEMWGKWEFLEIIAPERLVIIQYFSDPQGGVTRHPLSATWPLRTHSITRFDEGDGETLMTIASTPYQAEPGEIATFDAARPLVQQAWGGTMGQLVRFLAG